MHGTSSRVDVCSWRAQALALRLDVMHPTQQQLSTFVGEATPKLTPRVAELIQVHLARLPRGARASPVASAGRRGHACVSALSSISVVLRLSSAAVRTCTLSPAGYGR